MSITLNDLKQRAISAGYNLSGTSFQLCDWPIIKAFLAFEYGIHTDYNAVTRDITAKGNSKFDTYLTFEDKTQTRPVAGKYSYGTIHVNSGLNLRTTETVTVSSSAKVEIVQNGQWVPVTSFDISYTEPNIDIPFRFNPAQTGNRIDFTSPTFASTYLFVAIPFEPQEKTPAVCGEAVCGLTIVGDE